MQRRLADLIVINCCAIAALAYLFLPYELPVLRIMLALPLVLALPGYAVCAALFPQDEVDPPTRLLLSLSLSVTVAAIGGVLLNWTPWGLQVSSWTVLLTSVVIGASIIASLRRRGRSRAPNLTRMRMRWSQWLAIGLAGVIVIAAVGIARKPTPAAKFTGYTELWMVPVDQQSERTFRIGVRSMEFGTVNYRVQLGVGSRILQQWPSITLQPDKTWEQTATLPEDASGAESVRVLLFRADGPDWPPYRVVEWKQADETGN